MYTAAIATAAAGQNHGRRRSPRIIQASAIAMRGWVCCSTNVSANSWCWAAMEKDAVNRMVASACAPAAMITDSRPTTLAECAQLMAAADQHRKQEQRDQRVFARPRSVWR